MKTIIVLMSLLLFMISCSTIPRDSKTTIQDQWMGIYLKQEKIGYSFSRIAKVKNIYKITNRVKLSIAMMEQSERVISNFSGIIDTSFSLRSFEFSFQSLQRSFRAQGAIKDKKLVFEIYSGGTIKTESRDVGNYVYPVMVIGNVAMKYKFQALKEYLLKVFDATVLSVVDAKIKMYGKEPISIAGKSYNLTKMSVTMLGVTTVMWIDENGTVRKQESPPGMIIIEETKERALIGENEVSRLDILSLFSVPVETIIPLPRKTDYMKVQLVNLNYSEFNLIDDFQKVLMTNPLTLEITKSESLSDTVISIQGADEYLKSSVYIQCDDSRIQDLTKKIIGDEKNSAKIVENINYWVFNNVKKSATASLPSAVDVLQHLEGDCNEHAVLFAALTRAAGIPTQICVGLVYVDGSFYYHAWNKVYLGQWVGVDPTFGQFPSDATHIKLSEGELEEQAKIINIVGNIKIKILEFR